MLVLSIAMIGGISFFTSAYRIRYSYLEHANRLDHALRYVERLKVQRRDYPTAGYFQNIGTESVGFTVYFVNSSSGDVGPRPYFYEDYAEGDGGVTRIFIKNRVVFRDDPAFYGSANEYLQFYSAQTVKDGIIGHSTGKLGSYTKSGFVPEESEWEWKTASNINGSTSDNSLGYNLAHIIGQKSTDTWKPDTDVYNSTNGIMYRRTGTDANGIMSYNFDGIQLRLNRMSNDSDWGARPGSTSHVYYNGKWYGRVLKDTVNNIDTYFTYTYSFSDENRKFVYKGDYDAFLQLTFAQLKARVQLDPTTPNKTGLDLYYEKWINVIPGDWPAHAGKAIYPFYYHLRENRNDIIPGIGYGASKYMTDASWPKIVLPGTEPEGGSASGMSMEYQPHSLRFYTANPAGWTSNPSAVPGVNFFNDNLSEVVGMRIDATPSNPNPTIKPGALHPPYEEKVLWEDYTPDVTTPPRPNDTDGYGPNICVVAQVYYSKGLGKYRVEKFWWWKPAIWPPTAPTGAVGANAVETRKDNVNVFGIKVDLEDGLTGANKRRVTKYRRSAYISLYSVPTEAQAQEIVTELKTTWYNNLDGAVTRMKQLAQINGYKIIYIPFMQLYAHDDYSTLCERRD
ncbi:MAG: hypothetical protein FWG57_00175 [Endomicrobia bacterium]|nr:hypothetical protein [Endomicrobiia bacterium]